MPRPFLLTTALVAVVGCSGVGIGRSGAAYAPAAIFTEHADFITPLADKPGWGVVTATSDVGWMDMTKGLVGFHLGYMLGTTNASAGELPGSAGGASIVSGSHLDSQTPGGRYDGALGALGALIAIGALRQRYGRPRRTLEVVALCEEEGSRFPSAGWWGSRAITGRIAPGDWDRIKGYEDETIAATGMFPFEIITRISRSWTRLSNSLSCGRASVNFMRWVGMVAGAMRPPSFTCDDLNRTTCVHMWSPGSILVKTR